MTQVEPESDTDSVGSRPPATATAMRRDSSVFGGRCRRDPPWKFWKQSQWEMRVTAQVRSKVRKQVCEPLRPAAVRAALMTLDMIVLAEQLKKRPSVMKSVPHFLKGPFCNALRLALEEAVSEDVIRHERGWKLLLLLPRMLLFRPPRGGTISKDKLHDRFRSFASGEWLMLLEASGHCGEQAAIARRRRRGQGDDVQKRAARAELKVGGSGRVVVSQAGSGG